MTTKTTDLVPVRTEIVGRQDEVLRALRTQAASGLLVPQCDTPWERLADGRIRVVVLMLPPQPTRARQLDDDAPAALLKGLAWAFSLLGGTGLITWLIFTILGPRRLAVGGLMLLGVVLLVVGVVRGVAKRRADAD
jgi:hypothetical protein